MATTVQSNPVCSRCFSSLNIYITLMLVVLTVFLEDYVTRRYNLMIDSWRRKSPNICSQRCLQQDSVPTWYLLILWELETTEYPVSVSASCLHFGFYSTWFVVSSYVMNFLGSRLFRIVINKDIQIFYMVQSVSTGMWITSKMSCFIFH